MYTKPESATDMAVPGSNCRPPANLRVDSREQHRDVAARPDTVSESHAMPCRSMPSMSTRQAKSPETPYPTMPVLKTQSYNAMAPLRFSRRCNRPWMPQKTRKPWEDATVSCCPMLRQHIRSRAGEFPMTYSIDDDSGEHGGRHGRPVFGIVLAADELRMIVLEQETEGTQDDDRKGRDDEAIRACVSVKGAVDSRECIRFQRSDAGEAALLTKTMLAPRSRWVSSCNLQRERRSRLWGM
ncbi:hypothetical protein VTJ49DRAFT_5429 [Mycothermus thermophilus]|uniref:Uncharacterized protein n=1 Tax=Humicola insolens TaxID=85995 RepID=A0ABR3VKF2_HUMIN